MSEEQDVHITLSMLDEIRAHVVNTEDTPLKTQLAICNLIYQLENLLKDFYGVQ